MIIERPKQNSEEYISKDYICMQLHAMAELMTLFFSSDITIEECCKELNIIDFKELSALTSLIILINNFSEQKDEYHTLIKNGDYIKDNFDAFKFEYINVLEGNKAPKQIIKEVRDAFEHKSFYIHKSGKIYIENKRTGFKAIINMLFLVGAFYYYLSANNINGYLVDDRMIDYGGTIENLIDNLKIYRVIAKRKNEERNIDGLLKLDLKALTQELTFNDNYRYVEVRMSQDEKKALLDFFHGREINKENLFIGLAFIQGFGPPISNILNNFISMNFNVMLNINDTRKVISKFINNIENDTFLDKREKRIIKVFFEDNKYCVNYFKLLFVKYVIGNIDYEMTEEDVHIRNCLSHLKYSWLNSDEILLQDHPNGVDNESKITFMKKYNVDDLYNRTKELWIYTSSETNHKLK